MKLTINYLDRLYSSLFYGGLSKGLYTQIKPRVQKENFERSLKISFVAFLFGLVDMVLVAVGYFREEAFPLYIYLSVSQGIIYLLGLMIRKKEKWWLAYTYLFGTNVMLFAALLDTAFIHEAGRATVTFFVLMMALSVCIVDVPVRFDFWLWALQIIFASLLYHYKSGRIVGVDMANSIQFLILGILANGLISVRSLQRYADRLFIERERDTDSLTGLLTKGAAMTLIDTHIHQKTLGCCVMMDLDDFKGINDTHGHLFGDEVLKLMSSTIHRNIQRADVAGRFGGDEFLMFFPETELERAVEVAQQIHDGYHAAALRLFPDKGESIHCTIGVTQSTPQDTYETLFQRADEALYAAKEAGKDRVCSI